MRLAAVVGISNSGKGEEKTKDEILNSIQEHPQPVTIGTPTQAESITTVPQIGFK